MDHLDKRLKDMERSILGACAPIDDLQDAVGKLREAEQMTRAMADRLCGPIPAAGSSGVPDRPAPDGVLPRVGMFAGDVHTLSAAIAEAMNRIDASLGRA